MKLEKGRVYLAKALTEIGPPNRHLEDGWLWVYEGQVPQYDNHRFKSVATGGTVYTAFPQRWFEEDKDEDR
jgi:hypothetical protein